MNASGVNKVGDKVIMTKKDLGNIHSDLAECLSALRGLQDMVTTMEDRGTFHADNYYFLFDTALTRLEGGVARLEVS